MSDKDLPLQIAGLEHSFGSTRVLNDISLTVSPGQVHALLGPNGAGKSTTIAAAVGLLKPQKGTVRIFGFDPVTQHTQTAGLVGVMLQDGGLPAAAKPLQVLSCLSRLYRDPLDYRALAERLGITSFADRSIRRLSGGQKQRVGLAAALIGKPRLVFLDEPTAGLDPQAMLVVHEVISELRQQGVAVVLTTHDMHDAQTLADWVTVVDHGSVIASGTPAELIGEQECALRIVTAAEVPAALAGRLADYEVEISGTQLSIHGNLSTAQLTQILAQLAEEGVAVTDMHMAKRSLGDVFLDLTGRELR